MQTKFSTITRIDNKPLYDEAMAYVNALIEEATRNGLLDDQDADNEYTREIGRVGCMCADFETEFMNFKSVHFKSPLIPRGCTRNLILTPDSFWNSPRNGVAPN